MGTECSVSSILITISDNIDCMVVKTTSHGPQGNTMELTASMQLAIKEVETRVAQENGELQYNYLLKFILDLRNNVVVLVS